MAWPKTGATHYHPQLGLPDKGSAIKGRLAIYIKHSSYGRLDSEMHQSKI